MDALAELAKLWGCPVVEIDGRPGVRLVVDDRSVAVRKDTSGAVFRLELAPPGMIAFEIETVVGGVQDSATFGSMDLVLPVSAPFNRLFVVRTREVANLRRLWTPALAERMVSHVPFARLVCTGRAVELRMPWYQSTSVGDLGHAIEVLRTIGRMDAFGLRPLRDLTDGVFCDDEPGLPYVTVGPIRIGPVVVDDQHVTLAAMDSAPDQPDDSLEVVDGKPADPAAVTRLGLDADPHVAALGTATVRRTDGVVEVAWWTIEADRRRLDAGIAIVRALGRPMSTGVFR